MSLELILDGLVRELARLNANLEALGGSALKPKLEPEPEPAPKPEPTPKPEPEPAPEPLTLSELRARFKALADRGHKAALIGILSDFNVKSVAKLKPADYGDVAALLDKLERS